MYKKKLFVALVLLFFLLSVGPIVEATVYEVHPGESIQNAINNSVNGDELIVYSGTYKENINFSGKAITIKSIDPSNQAVIAATIIDGDKNGSVVTFNNSEGNSSILNGLTIQNGLDTDGGGIYCYNSSSPRIINCIIFNNGAIGGIRCKNYSSPDILNCIICCNSGGGISCSDHSSPKIEDCILSGNKTEYYGGGIRCYNYCSPTIDNCHIFNNIADGQGGGIYCYGSSSPQITNCIVISNTAGHGGGVYCYNSSSPKITNCTISSNKAIYSCGGIYCYNYCYPVIYNSILWGNTVRGISNEIYQYSSSVTITYSDIQQDSGVYPGTGNINSNPQFIESEIGNFSLKAGSPCIDSGNITGAPSEDKEGIDRPQGSGVDMGAYEFVGPDSCTPRALFTADKIKGIDTLTVEFDAASSGGSQYEGAIFSWDFGDGSNGSGLIVSHTYSQYGSYDVSLSVTTTCGTHQLILHDLIKIKSSQPTKEVGDGYTYSSIQEAINDASYGDVILVHDGTYNENIDFQGKVITVHSENGAENTIIDGDDNGSVVTFNSSEGLETELDGFTLQNGFAADGGGIYCNVASPTIKNCIINNNEVDHNGGGIYCSVTSPSIKDCIINDNYAEDNGGGICLDKSSSSEIVNCSIYNNVAFDKDGGGIYCSYYSNPNILNCNITNNLADYGGGICCYDNVSVNIKDCSITGNTAYNYGGGIYCYRASSVIMNCIINENKAYNGGGIYYNSSSSPSFSSSIIKSFVSGNSSENGGGIYCRSSSSNIQNSILSLNRANSQGGGIYYSSSSSSSITNCSLNGNHAYTGGGIYSYSSSLNILNSIFWNDTSDGDVNEIYHDSASSFTVDYSDIQQDSGVYTGTGNINSDPKFFDSDTGNYYLKTGSPCIDFGDSAGAPSDDKEGIVRPQGSGVDMGAYEYVGPDSCTPRAFFIANQTIGMTPFSVEFDATFSGGSQYEGAILSWDFGDGTNGSGLTVSHTYSQNGFFDVSLTVTTACGTHQLILHDLIKIKSSVPTREVGDGYAYSSIQEAINDASYGDMILVHNGTYNENINFLGKVITVRSENGAENTIIDGGGNGSVVTFNSREGLETILDGFTLQNGFAGEGGGIYCNNSSSPSVKNCLLNNNSSEYSGGGIYCISSSSPHITNCTLSTNTSGEGGGIYCEDSSPTINNCYLTNNTANGPGGGMSCNYSSPAISDCNLNENTASNGGAIYCYRSSPNIINCNIYNNITSAYGGGIYCYYYSSPDIKDCNIINNVGDYGGGGIFCNNRSVPNILNCTLNYNTSSSNGGAIYCNEYSSATLTNCIIKYNTGYSGGGIYSYRSSLSISDCIITHNKANSNGGGIICSYYSSPTIDRSDISYNTSNNDGGGLGVYTYSSPNIINCAINANKARSGGGIYCYNSCNPRITNCTICSNNADSAGGGIAVGGTSSLVLYNSIHWSNSAGVNTDEVYQFSNGSVNATYSNIRQESDVYPGTGNINSDPQFVDSEAGNFYLKAGSPCINSGDATNAPSEDKEGIDRPQGSGVDMGAFEYVGPDSCIPRASFIPNQTNGVDTLTVEFDAASSGGSQYEGVIFSWDFGDSHSGTGMIVSHTYSQYGSYDISLTVTTACGTHQLTLYNLIKIKSSQPTREVGDGYTYSSIQEAIEEAVYGEVILVHDGTYNENIDFLGKVIIVRSENGAGKTIIDGGGNRSVVTFKNGEGLDTVLDGFTLRNGFANDGNGGGIYCYKSSPSIINCRLIYNIAAYDGGGIYSGYGSPNIKNCTINDNTSNNMGGGIACYNSSPNITNCLITTNTSTSRGGGIHCDSSSSPIITNCILTENNWNGISCSFSSSPRIINCTLGNNNSYGIYCYSSSPIIFNSILWGNTTEEYPDEIYQDSSSSVTITYSDIHQDSGVYPGTGNINSDPKFFAGEAGNYYLNASSPCIDTGDAANAPLDDKEGIMRPQGSGVDMGAYEYVGPDSCTPRALFTINQTIGMTPLTVEFDATTSGGGQYEGAVFSWDFGDGTNGSGLILSHTYSQNGSYDVSLTVTTACGTHQLILYDLIKIRSSQPTKEVGDGYAYNSIQEAINDAGYGEVILVHDGTYNENIDFLGKVITVCSENGAENTIIDGGENESVVTFKNHEGLDTVLDGFTLRNGSANDGGGIYCKNSSPSIIHCFIIHNTAYYNGGGIYGDNSSPDISNCNISNNNSYEGGGIYFVDSSSYIDESVISENITELDGAGIYFIDSSLSIINSIISDNKASGSYGGGLYCDDSSLDLKNCDISSNISYNGGGICCRYSDLNIASCKINNNISGGYGGGITCSNSSTSVITNSVITDNMSSTGGGIYCENSSLNIKNCSLVYNTATSNGREIYCDCYYNSSSLAIHNSILWGNASGGGPSEIYNSSCCSISVNYSDVQQDVGIYPGTGNINSDPKFILSEAGNYYLKSGSPCIDTGDNVDAPSEDLEGFARPQGSGVDMGAYEYAGPDSCTPRASFVVNQTRGVSPLTVEFDATSSSGSQYEGAILSWDFGDDYSENGLIVSHTYSQYGSYDVSLTVTTACGTHQLLLHDLIKIKSPEPTIEVGEGYPYSSIQEAINNAGYGEVILVHDGIYNENINFQGKGVTLYSENGAENTIIDGGQNGSVVTFNSGEDLDAVLDGFTLQYGYANYGGGIHCENSSPTIRNCSINNNGAMEGGGIYCTQSLPDIINCFIENNNASREAGGIYCISSSSPNIINCTVSHNNVEIFDGGGIRCNNYSSPNIINCIINGNVARYGAGIHCYSGSSPVIKNCTISNNTSSQNGGGIYCNINSSPPVTNSILWNDSPNEIYISGSSPIFTYSNIQGGYLGTGNIDLDPLFVDTVGEDYHLQNGSPCIDAGTGEGAPDSDKDGSPRPIGGGYDIGAYEFIYDFFSVLEGDYTSSSQVQLQLFSNTATEMIISEDPEFSNTTWEPFLANKIFTLSSGDGEKTVYVKFKYSNNEESEVLSESIILDATPPVLLINNPSQGEFVNKLVSISADASDLIGLIKLEYYIDSELKNSFDLVSVNSYSFTMEWDTRDYTDGDHIIKIIAYDKINNTPQEIGVVISYVPPAAPLINSHIDGSITDQSSTTVSGTADPLCNIEIYINGMSAGICSSDSQGDFDCSEITLVENTNSITATASDVKQTSQESSPIEVILDTVPLIPAIAIDQGDFTDQPDITLTITCDNATLMMISESPGFDGASWQAYQTNLPWTLSSGDGQKTVYAKFIKDYGFESPVVSDTIRLDATPPSSPALSLSSQTCDSAIIEWAGYSAPDDLAGFEIYRETGTSYNSVENLTPSAFLDSASRNYQFSALELDTSYYVAVVAVDTTGNKISSVNPLEILIATQIPPQVHIGSIRPGSEPDSALISWSEYNTDTVCGFSGFEVYYQDIPFTSVTGLTPEAVLDASVQSYQIEGLDLTKDCYFAVVGFNNLNESNPEVLPIAWSESYGPELHVYPGWSIQIAINAAINGDVIVTHPGTYPENINFAGKAITVRGIDPQDSSIVASTIIDGGQAGSVVTFNSGEGNSTILNGFTLQNGKSSVYGGGIYCSSSSPTITNCIIIGNSAIEGGGISCYPNSSPVIANCIISQNSANYGGGIACSHSSPNIINCVIIENTSSVSFGGGGILSHTSSPTITNCTISRNSANQGGGISCYSYSSSAPIIKNSIIWSNSPNEIYLGSGPPSVTYCDIQGGYSGEGNIDQDPLFLDPDAGDYRPQSGSSCIDSGTNAGAPSTDIEGNPRPMAAGYDMGAYEFIAETVRILEGDYTKSTEINLYLYSQTAVEMIISEDPDFLDAEWESYQNDKAFTLSINDGQKTVYARFKDALGLESDLVSDTIILDSMPPSITITTPQPGETLSKIITVSATVADSSAVDKVEFYIDEEKKTEIASPQGPCTWEWDTRGYDDAAHALKVTAYDILENNQSEQINVFVSYESPSSPTLTSPVYGTLTSQPTISVSGTADPICTIEIYVNGTTACTSSSDAQGIFTCSGIPLTENCNTITAIATDGYQTSTESLSIEVILDTIPLTPQISIDQGEYTNNPAVNITLNCDNATQMMLSEVTDFSDTTWQAVQTEFSFTLSSGDGTKTVYAKFKKDYGFESSVVSDSIVLSTASPQVSITQPQDGATIIGNGQAQASITSLVPVQQVAFYMDDMLQITDNEAPYTWDFSGQNFSDGLHTLKAEAMDAFGRTGSSGIHIITGDIIAPPAVQGFNTTRGDACVDLSWSASPAGDLDHYNIYMSTSYFTTVSGMTPIATTTSTSYKVENLTNGITQWFAVTAIDASGNEEKMVTPSGATPQDLDPDPVTSFTATDNYPEVTLTWNQSTVHDFLRYKIYQSLFPINDVLGLTPIAQISEQTTQNHAVMDLSVKQTYYFAIVVEDQTNHISNISSASIYLPDLSPVVSITQPQNGATITRPTIIQATATDPDGVAQVEFFVDNSPVFTDTASPYTYAWDIFGLTPRSYQLKAKATDTKSYTAEQSITVYVEPGPPPAPVITSPSHNTTLSDAQVQVTGTAQTGTQVYVMLNSIQTAGPLDVTTGQFSAQIILTEGQNWIEATAQDQGGVSPKSQSILVTLDLQEPEPPRLVQTASLASGKVRITWQTPLGETPAGYNVYRADQPFYNTVDAQRLNSSLITANSFDDIPFSDGVYYYAVTSIDVAGNESSLSDPIEGRSDSLPPEVTELTLTPHGPTDQNTGRCGKGQVDVLITVSEELMTTPFMSITPQDGFPISINLARLSSTQYSGSFEITESTPSGQATIIFSGRDLVGNRGTQINAPHTLNIDTDGPAIIDLQINPQAPIENDPETPVTLDITITLDQPVKENTVPQLWYRYTQNTQGIEITPLTQDTIDPLTYHAQFTLAPEVGSLGQDFIEIFFQALDDLDNLGETISTEKRFEVYQGELPALGIPVNVSVKALPAGDVRISWNGVPDASGYQLYHKAPGEAELTLYGDIIQVLSFVDNTSVDGLYQYAVSSARILGGEIALSPLSSVVSVITDSIPPDQPQNLNVQLIGSGIVLTWEAPFGEEPDSYRAYRAGGVEITSTDGLTPIQANIVGLTYLDTHPSLTQQCYCVTAVDAAGNESAQSDSVYYNFSLLPVPTLTVTAIEGELPVLSWTSPGGNIASYNAYVKIQDEEIPMHSAPLLNTTIMDDGYNLTDREYTVTAVDINGFESVGHKATLQVLSTELTQDAMICRGIVNRLHFLVTSASPEPAHVSRLEVTYQNTTYASEAFTVDPGTTKEVSVVVGGNMDLPDNLPLTITLIQSPETNTTIKTISYAQIPVGEAALSLSINNDVLTRGSIGQVSFTLYNTTTETIEVISAKPNNQPSPDIRFKIMDPDGNVLSCVSLMQNTGTDIVAVSNGYSVARIDSAKGFTCQETGIFLPLSAPDEVFIQAEIDRVYYHYSRQDQVEVPGIVAVTPVSLVDTSYYARVLTVAPMVSIGDSPVTISGIAFDRRTDEPLGLVPVKIGISVRGFTKYTQVYTNDTGEFSYDYVPVYGEAGFYTTWAVHPEVVAQPKQAYFSILRLSVNPTTLDLRIPKNYTQSMTVTVKNLGETALSNLRLLYESAYQPEGVLPEGIIINTGTPFQTFQGNASKGLTFTITGQDTAPQQGQLFLLVKSDEVQANEWGLIRINYTFTEAKPVLQFSPNHLEVGVRRNNTKSATLHIKNAGLSSLNDIHLSLLPKQGQPVQNWIKLGVSSDQGNLPAGASRDISVVFQPGENISDNIYEYTLRIESSNYQTTDINLYATVTSSENGNALIHVADLYEGTENAQGSIIYGLAGANIQLQHSTLLHLIYTGTSDTNGDYLFTDLPAGKYSYRVSATKHEARAGTLFIQPGLTANERVFLETKLVTVEWEVVPIVIEDRYEIKITTTFETDVPAPVVTVEPMAINIPDMEVGEVYNGEFTFTNHGLIRAENFRWTLPQSDQYYNYQFLTEVPKTLEAKQQIILPFRLTCLTILGEESGTSTGGTGGGGGYSYSKSGNAVFDWSRGSCGGTGRIQFVFYKAKGESGTTYSTGGVSGGSGSYVYSGPGGSGSGSVSYKAQPLSGDMCKEPPPKPPITEVTSSLGIGGKGNKESGRKDCSSSHVDLVTGEYSFSVSDLSLLVNGFDLEIARTYSLGAWYFSHTMDRTTSIYTNAPSKFKSLINGGKEYIEKLVKGDIEYSLEGELAFDYINVPDPTGLEGQNYLYKNEIYTIRTKGGYFDASNKFHFDKLLWQSPDGDWREYDQWGRRIAYGDRNIPRIELLLEDGENGKMLGAKDATGRQVLWYEYNPDDTISAVHDHTGRRVEYFYDTGGHLIKVKDVLGNEWSYTYDGSGRIIQKTDPLGRSIHITYNADGSVESLLNDESNGKYYEYDYDYLLQEYYAAILTSGGIYTERYFNKDGEIIKELINGNLNREITYDGRTRIIKNRAGNETIKKFDEWNNLIYIQNPDGTSLAYKYDVANSNLIEERSERGVITRFEYDEHGNRIKMAEAAGTALERITCYTYDEQGNMLSTVLPDGALIGMEYDQYGRMVKYTDAENSVTENTYNEFGNRIAIKDARDHVWSYGYDARGRLISKVDPLNHITRYEYDAVGNRTAVVDAKENRTEYTYDLSDRTKEVKDALEGVVVYEYDFDGHLIKVTDQVNNITQYEYDSEGRRSKMIDAMGNETRYSYDETTASGCFSCASGAALGKPSLIIYPTYTKNIEYDSMGRVTREIEVLDESNFHETQYFYDTIGNIIKKTDPEGNATSYVYDSFNRLIRVIDAANGATQYGYDLRDNLTSLTDAEGNTTTFTYDKNGRKEKETRRMGQEFNYTYDEVGNISTSIDAKGQMTAYEYDEAGRQTFIRYFSASDHNNPEKTVAFTYDEIGNLISYNDGTTSGTYNYDDLSRKTLETANYGAFSLSYSYDYYADGAKKSFTGPDDITYNYIYNNGHLSTITIPGVGDITYNNYQWQVPNRITFPGGTVRQIEYDPLVRVKKINVQNSSGTILMDYNYTRDTMGNILSKTTEHGDYSYTYDNIYQLLSANNPDIPEINDEAYTYDKVGNRLTDNSYTGVWDYNNNNQLTGYDSVSFAYDDNGNTIQKNENGVTTNYFYNLEDRLERVEDGSGAVIATYYYDPIGKRLKKDIAGIVTYYFYSDEGLIGEYDASGNVIKEYGYKPDSIWTTDPVFMKEGGYFYFYHNDLLGTPQKITNEAGSEVWSIVYNVFGRSVRINSTINNNLRFAGQYFDAETGFHYNWNRYYIPEIGRYLSQDLIGLDAGEVNPYWYVRNNPISIIDPLGLEGYDFARKLLNMQIVREKIRELKYKTKREVNAAKRAGDRARERIEHCGAFYENNSKECDESDIIFKEGTIVRIETKMGIKFECKNLPSIINENGKIYDQIATIHTHPNEREVSPSGDDLFAHHGITPMIIVGWPDTVLVLVENEKFRFYREGEDYKKVDSWTELPERSK